MKNLILKTVMSIILFIAIVSACCLDSKTYIPFIVLAICSLILSLFAYANNMFRWSYENENDY